MRRRLPFFLTIAFLTAAAMPWSAAAQDTRYACTEFIGYSQMGNPDYGGWGPYAAITMNNGGADRVQLRWQNGGAAFRWAERAYEGWRAAPVSPCDQSSRAPDRLVLDITHNEYLTSARTNGDPVGFMETRIRNFIATARTHYPSAVSIVLQPVVGGPDHTTCPFAGAELGLVRATYNHPYIHQAIARIVGGDVTMGYDSQVRTCADYRDWEGHLTDAAKAPVGNAIGAYYRDLSSRATPPPASPPAPAPAAPEVGEQPTTEAPSEAPASLPSPDPVCDVDAGWSDGSIDSVDEMPCP